MAQFQLNCEGEGIGVLVYPSFTAHSLLMDGFTTVRDPGTLQSGRFGVIEEGAYADILLVEGNPLEDITVIGGNPKLFDAPDRKAGGIATMDLIMKDGKIYKNSLSVE